MPDDDPGRWCFWTHVREVYRSDCGHETIGDLDDDVSNFVFCPFCGVHMLVLEDRDG